MIEPIESHGYQEAAWARVPAAPPMVCEPEGTYGPARKPRLLDQVREAIRARHYSCRTEEAYSCITPAHPEPVEGFILFHGKRHPVEMGPPEITQYLTALAVERRVAASTQNQALAALIFLYKDVLGGLGPVGGGSSRVWLSFESRVARFGARRYIGRSSRHRAGADEDQAVSRLMTTTRRKKRFLLCV